jgi:hypothetical protein
MLNRQEFPSLREGLVGAWCPSLGGSGLSLIDRSGRGSNGTHTGAMTAAPGGLALDLSGTQSARFANASLLYPSLTSVTYSVWVRMRSFTNAYNALLETQTNATMENNYQFTPLIKSNGKLAFYVFQTAALQSNYDGTGAFTLSTNEWYHLCFTFLGGVALAGYVNGILDQAVSSPIATIAASSGPVRIGNSVFATRTLNGQLDDIRLYSRVLTVPEIRLLASRRGIGLVPLPDRAAGLPRKLFVNVGGTWRPGDAYVNVGGTWKLAQALTNVAGTWR